MKLGRRITGLLVIGAMALLPGCDDDNTGTAVVQVAGNFLVPAGTNSQLAATTVNATDSGYSWGTSNPGVATVSGTGMVTGVAPGEVVITATGDSSGAQGTIGIVVPAEPIDPGQEIQQLQDWQTSGHADQSAEAFRHWDGDGAVPSRCAKCHSTPGYRDFLGDDGTAARVVDNDAPLGTTVECNACHNPTAIMWDSVIFPSGVEESNLGAQARCMECHQGRSSKDGVDQQIADAGATGNDDVINGDLGFINVHYFPAGATRFGGRVRGGYLYDGMLYDTLFEHAPGIDTCNTCHDPHTLHIQVDTCADCHGNLDLAELRDIRTVSSATIDYDGDGNLSEGIFYEITTLREKLLTAVQRYATEVVGTSIVYDPGSYPYWFIDTNGNGISDAGEASFGNRYGTWTPRMVKATYNYQYATKDPGGFAHNAKFIIQLLYDSIMDVNSAISSPVDMSGASRHDMGHFDGTEEAFRHWDEDGEVSASCAQCHSASPGYTEWLTYKTNTPQEIANGLDCETCHTNFSLFTTRVIDSVPFVSGYETPDASGQAPDSHGVMSNMCIVCHQGRVSKSRIDDVIASGSLSFQNIHYLAAAATLFGDEAEMGYQYMGKDYSGKFPHSAFANNNNCTQCHNPGNTEHTFLPEDNLAYCQGCHTSSTTVFDIRLGSTDDYDGDGNATEWLVDELHDLSDDLYDEIRSNAATNGTPIFYDSHAYPYFFNDNGGGANFGNRFTAWTPALLKAAHNFQHSKKEVGAWAHNFAYIAQLVIDSIEDLGGDVSGYVRPPVDY